MIQVIEQTYLERLKQIPIRTACFNWNRLSVHVPQAAPNDNNEVLVITYCNGDITQPWYISGEYPVLVDPTGCTLFLEEEARKRARLPRTAQLVTKEIKNELTGEVTYETVKKAVRTRGEVDPRTGYGVGTDAHAFGLIMLETGLGQDKKPECLEKIAAILVPRGKAKSYASNWYNYLKIKKPEIYGGK